MIAPYVQTAAGIAQSIFGGLRARKSQRELENLQMPVYSPSKSIIDYYNQAKSRYNISPYQSNLYKLQEQNIRRGTAQGLQALQGRGAALAGVGSLVQGQNDAYLKAAAAAEQEQNRRFGELGQAAQMKAGEDYKMYQYNKLMPFERKSSLLGAKAAGGAATFNAGLSNIFGGLQGIDQGAMMALQMLGGGGAGMAAGAAKGGGGQGSTGTWYSPQQLQSGPFQIY